MKKIKIAPQPNLQEKLKFSRLVMVDNFAYISGTAPFDEDLNVVFPKDAYQQTCHCLNIIKTSLEAIKFEMNDIVRVRLYIRDMNNLEQIIKAFNEFFLDILPACSIIQTAGFIDENMHIYIDADAHKPSKD